MKILGKLTLAAIISFFLTSNVSAQRILKRLQEKVEQKVEQKIEERAERKIDETIDRQLDKVEGSIEPKGNDNRSSTSSSTKSSDERMQNLLKGFGLGGEPVPIADSYRFKHLINMQVDSYDKNGKKSSGGNINTLLNPDNKSMAYEIVSGDIESTGQGMFIIDSENGAIIILNDEDGEKNGIVYGMGAFFSTLGETYEEELSSETPEAYLANPNIKKTGRTKKIAGYSCEEYKYSDEVSESEIWITKELKMNTQDFFSTLFRTNIYAGGMPWGYLMEATTIDKESGEKTSMHVTKVDPNADVVFNMTNYQLTNLGSLSGASSEGN